MEQKTSKKEKCKVCDGYAHLPRLFEGNIKCPHCDKNGYPIIIKDVKSNWE